MKKIVFVLSLLFYSLVINSQIKVDSLGRIRLDNTVALGTATTFSNNVGLKTYKSARKGQYSGILSHISTESGLFNNTFLTPIYGQVTVTGVPPLPTAKSNSDINRFVAAVTGIAEGGIGIYGKYGSGFPSSGFYPFCAGYFDGNVIVSGTLTTSTLTTASDLRLKTNISSIDKQHTSSIYLLNPIAYNFKQDTVHLYYDAKSEEMENIHYGLIAQEVQKYFPNLVYENLKDGYLSVNYVELIPLLISSIQEVKSELDSLKFLYNDVTLQKKSSKNNDFINSKLYQNNPNPFNQSTVIRYDLPLETSQANLYIYDMTGAQIASYSITDFGSGSITISAGNLKAGMYLYSLIADGQIIDTKQMILTK